METWRNLRRTSRCCSKHSCCPLFPPLLPFFTFLPEYPLQAWCGPDTSPHSSSTTHSPLSSKMISAIVAASSFAGLAAAAPVANIFATAAQSVSTFGPFSESYPSAIPSSPSNFRPSSRYPLLLHRVRGILRLHKPNQPVHRLDRYQQDFRVCLRQDRQHHQPVERRVCPRSGC